MLLAVIPISEYMAGDTQNSNNNYLLVLIFDIAVGYFCMYIAALLKFNVLKRKNQALENALTEKQQENVAILLAVSYTHLLANSSRNTSKRKNAKPRYLYPVSRPRQNRK